MDTPRLGGPGELDGRYELTVSWANFHLPEGPLLLVGLEPTEHGGGTADLAARGWPLWPKDGAFTNPGWAVTFLPADRMLLSIARLNKAGDRADYVLAQAHPPQTLTDDMWSMVQRHRKVLLCGPLPGAPTLDNLRAAVTAGELRALLADAVMVDGREAAPELVFMGW